MAKTKWASVRHKQIYLKTRGHRVDIHVYPVMQMLWDAGIQTFFSCQGGPDRFYDGGKIKSNRAYVVVLMEDQKKALKVLASRNPEVKKWENRYRRDQVSIKFDPSPEAQAAIVTVQTE